MAKVLTVLAYLRAKTGQQTRLQQELQRLVEPTRAEAGCMSYDLHESQAEPGLFMFYEVWKSEADLDAHFKTPHMLTISKLVPELLEVPLDLTKWTKL